MGSVYIIHNLVSSKVYIGATTQIPSYRLRQHRKLLISGKHDNPKLQHSFNKHGIDNFEFDILETDLDNNTLYKQETFWIEYFRYIGAELYNIQHPEKIRFGIPLTEEHKQKLRIANLGKKQSQETKQKNREHGKRVWGCDEGRSRMSDITSREWKGIIDPTGMIYAPIKNLNKFCNEHGLEYSGVRKMLQGKLKHYKRWTRL